MTFVNEHAQYRGFPGLLNHFIPAAGYGVLCPVPDPSALGPSGQTGAGTAAGPLLARLNTKLAEIVQTAATRRSSELGLTVLVLAAVDVADCSYTEISLHPSQEGPDLVRAVDRIIDGAQRFFEANSPAAEQDAALVCAGALETYGWALHTSYGHAAAVATAQLRTLGIWMWASLLRPAFWN